MLSVCVYVCMYVCVCMLYVKQDRTGEVTEVKHVACMYVLCVCCMTSLTEQVCDTGRQ